MPIVEQWPSNYYDRYKDSTLPGSWECHRCGTVWASWVPCCSCKPPIVTTTSLVGCNQCGYLGGMAGQTTCPQCHTPRSSTITKCLSCGNLVEYKDGESYCWVCNDEGREEMGC